MTLETKQCANFRQVFPWTKRRTDNDRTTECHGGKPHLGRAHAGIEEPSDSFFPDTEETMEFAKLNRVGGECPKTESARTVHGSVWKLVTDREEGLEPVIVSGIETSKQPLCIWSDQIIMGSQWSFCKRGQWRSGAFRRKSCCRVSFELSVEEVEWQCRRKTVSVV